MLKKFTRFLAFEPRLKSLLGLALILTVIAVVEAVVLKNMARRLKQAAVEKELVSRIDEMKAELNRRQIRVAPKEQKTPDKIVLQGTVLKGKVYHALINGSIYKAGDFVSGYRIKEISKTSVVLENKSTQEVGNLHIPELSR